MLLARSLASVAAAGASAAAKRLMRRRPPVVTIMGHVDHGKTTLLDQLRNSNIVQQEYGGITQHIGAFVVPLKSRNSNNSNNLNNSTEMVTFLDTPGHAAFAAMRQRGANVTDIVVLVVAAEDGILDQTVESINYAQNSEVPIIVALNKIDKFTNDHELSQAIEIVEDGLRVHGLVTESQGGDTQLVKISALNNIGLDHLKESIVALAETLELKADYDCPAEGTIIESSLHPHRGQLCTILMQSGTLRRGDIIVGGRQNWARIRSMFDERGQVLSTCTPGRPAQVIGWRTDHLPSAGDVFQQVDSERSARSIVAEAHNEAIRSKALADAKMAAQRAEEHRRVYEEKLAEKKASGYVYRPIRMAERGVRLSEKQTGANDHTLNLIIKADVNGSLEALLNLLDTYDPHNRQMVKLAIVHYGVGHINENDYQMAATFGQNSVVYGFNVKYANQQLAARIRRENQVPVKLFNVIYHLIDDLRDTIVERTPRIEQLDELGSAIVLQEFVVDERAHGKRKVHVAGSRCNRGQLKRDSYYRVIRNGECLLDRIKIHTMRHLKDDVNVIAKEQECGLSFEQHEDFVFRPGDLLTCYDIKLVKPKLKWDLKGSHFSTS